MRRITLWITATIAVAAVLLAFQLNRSGTTGKSGDSGDHAQPGATAPASPGPSRPGDSRPGSTDGQHDPKAGENK